MTRGMFVVGGAGSGKSTFTGHLMRGLEFGPLTDLHSRPGGKVLASGERNVVTLRGHEVEGGGVYLGIQREQYPGADGLDRVSHQVIVNWFESGLHQKYEWVFCEGNNQATEAVLAAFGDYTDFRLLHLDTDEVIRDLWLYERNKTHKPTTPDGAKRTRTAAANAAEKAEKRGSIVRRFDAADPLALSHELGIAKHFLGISPGD